MATLTAQVIDRDGLTLTLAAADAGGDEFDPAGGQNFLYVLNGGASPVTVTITSFATESPGLIQDDLEVAVTNGADPVLIGPFTQAFADPANSRRVQVAYSDVSSVEVAVVRHNPNS